MSFRCLLPTKHQVLLQNFGLGFALPLCAVTGYCTYCLMFFFFFSFLKRKIFGKKILLKLLLFQCS